MKPAALYALLVLWPVTSFAGDAVHRWVDERGVVNYGDRPPEGRKSTRIETADPLGVTEPVRRLPAPPAPAGSSNSGLMDRGAVQREVESALQRERAAAAQESAARREAAMAEARRRCEEQRRVDCDHPGLVDENVYVGPPRIVRRHYPLYPPVVKPPAQPAERPMLMRKGP